ncbi:hypothetical protein [Desulfosarcina ovata]|uniref:Uncharacterized protein n=2 Tax=Desulfosarcina ovata TaxID=83564 RepID=A0A5K8AJX7_9BACT|nr:hypothetical protein [Desulfosarcina ovata]BBO85806.1 hypothetical protein DSCO28_63720 [Desulfosarcina ovata subsp. sediminis]BBO92816.1 hypothetical protein DSCOOX_59960 [Desulfosarcina ovata subsp. ovata]
MEALLKKIARKLVTPPAKVGLNTDADDRTAIYQPGIDESVTDQQIASQVQRQLGGVTHQTRTLS